MVREERCLQQAKRGYCRSTTTLVAVLGMALVMLPLQVLADAPLACLKESIGKITTVLDDKAFRESHSRAELNAKLIGITQDRFDWKEIARRSLGLYWKDRSQKEQEEFSLLLKDLLIHTYLDKIVDNYSGESILYDKEVIKGQQAFIEMRIINKSEKSIALGVRMLKADTTWLIYDLIIEGVSSIKNYRVQFYDIMRKSSYEELINKLQTKVQELTRE